MATFKLNPGLDGVGGVKSAYVRTVQADSIKHEGGFMVFRRKGDDLPFLAIKSEQVLIVERVEK